VGRVFCSVAITDPFLAANLGNIASRLFAESKDRAGSNA